MGFKSQCRPLEVNVHWARPQSVDLNLVSILSESERYKASQFVFERDRKLYLAAHIFLRCILSNYSGINPEKLDFAHNAFGKPSLHSETKLRFNLSHTSGMIVCGISYGLDVGVGVENHTRSIDMHSILKSSYSSNETENVLRQNSKLQQRLFFSYWTLK